MTATKSKRICAKRGPKKHNREQERANAAKLKLKVLAMLKDCSHSVKEMAAELECKPSTLRDYLFRMSNEGLVSSVLEKGYGGAPFSAVYSLGEKNPNACDRTSQRTLKEYPANQVRDPFHLPQNFFSRTA